MGSKTNICIGLDADTYEWLKASAEDIGSTPTQVARKILTDQRKRSDYGERTQNV